MKTIIQKPESLYKTYERKPGEDKRSTHYCPGCGHGVVHKLIAEVMDDLEIRDKTIFVSPVGCSVFGYYYFDCGNVQAAHGRAPAVGTGVTRSNPDNYVISYQGDGDLAAIGTAEILHAANRGEKMTIFFVNNAIYGMTGGQMAPTSHIGQKTVTSPYGRAVRGEGYPLKMAELIATLESPVYVTRVSLHDMPNRIKTKTAVKKAIKSQVDGKGFSFVEILSPCPMGWKVDPMDQTEWMIKNMLPYFPLGIFKDDINEREGFFTGPHNNTPEKLKEVLGISETDKDPGGLDHKFTSKGIKTAGFGGQGVLLLGTLISRIGMKHGYNVTWLPSYGPEMRGGTANCSVVIDEETIGSPAVEEIDILIAMNGPSLKKFAPMVNDDGVILYNSSIIENPDCAGIESFGVPASDLADNAGSSMSANIVMLGAISAHFGYFSSDVIDSVLIEQFKKPEVLKINQKAFQLGFKDISK